MKFVRREEGVRKKLVMVFELLVQGLIIEQDVALGIPRPGSSTSDECFHFHAKSPVHATSYKEALFLSLWVMVRVVVKG